MKHPISPVIPNQNKNENSSKILSINAVFISNQLAIDANQIKNDVEILSSNAGKEIYNGTMVKFIKTI